MIIPWAIAAFLSGSCMFSYWLGRVVHEDLTTVGDSNPGAVNLWTAAGYKLGVAGVALDFAKGYLPLILFMEHHDIRHYGIVGIAIAPILGHAFSPFLRGKGGKAIAVTFGVWSALTGFEVSLAYAVILAALWAITRAVNRGKPASVEANGVQVVLGMLAVFIYLYARAFPGAVLWFWLCNLLLLICTHRRELLVFCKAGFSA